MTQAPIDKSAFLDELRGRVREQLATITQSQQSSQDGAAHEESRPEDPKDMRSTEASYLARGLAERVGQLQTAEVRLAEFAPPPFPEDAAVSLGALVTVEDEDGQVTRHLLVPAAGGERLEVSGVQVRTLTLDSPLGQELVGRERDDEFEIDLPRGRTTCTILEVA